MDSFREARISQESGRKDNADRNRHVDGVLDVCLESVALKDSEGEISLRPTFDSR